GHDARRLADLPDPLRGLPQGILNDRLLPVTDVAERGCQVVGADEYAVDAINRGDLLDLIEGAATLNLHDQADLLLRAVQIVLDAAESRRPRGAADAADAGRRVARGRHRRPRLLGRLHEGNEERLNADVQEAL